MGADVSRPRLRCYLSRYLFAGPRSVQTLVSVHLVCASNTGGLFSFLKMEFSRLEMDRHTTGPLLYFYLTFYSCV